MAENASRQTPDEMIEGIIELAGELDRAVAGGGDGTRAGMALTAACNKLACSGGRISEAHLPLLLEAIVKCSDDHARKQLAVIFRERGGLAVLKHCDMSNAIASCVLDAIVAVPRDAEPLRRQLSRVLKGEVGKEMQLEQIVKAMLAMPDKSVRMKLTGVLYEEFGTPLLDHLNRLFERIQVNEPKLRVGESVLFILNKLYWKEHDVKKKEEIGKEKKRIQAVVDAVAKEMRDAEPAQIPLSARIKQEYGDLPLPSEMGVVKGGKGKESEEEVPTYKSDGKTAPPGAPKPPPQTQNAGTNRFEKSRQGGIVPAPKKDPWWKNIFRRKKQTR